MTLRDVFHFTALTALIVWILVMGKTVILPIVVAVMLTYVLVGATKALRQLPLLSIMPVWLAYVLALTIFGLALATISLVSVANLRDIAQTAPAFEENVTRLLERIGTLFRLSNAPTWDSLRELAVDRLDVPELSLLLLSSIASIGGYTVLVSTYVVFMVAERIPLSNKIDLVLPNRSERGAAGEMFHKINGQIVTYLSTKTLINGILGVLSYAIMWALGIENAVFWAFLIGMFNYIPYVGSLIGVGVVLFYTALISGQIQLTLLALITLTTAQVYVGNWLEPRIMSRSFNLSPVVVLMALVIWSSVWGLAGAIIAVPMTSIVMIVLGAFKSTRAIPILASRDGQL